MRITYDVPDELLPVVQRQRRRLSFEQDRDMTDEEALTALLNEFLGGLSEATEPRRRAGRPRGSRNKPKNEE